MNNIDWSIILIILIFMLLGSLKGFVNSVIGLVEYFFSIFLAYKLSPFFASFIVEKWGIDEKISSVINSLIPNVAEQMINNSEKYSQMLEASGQTMENVKMSLSNMEIPFIDTITDRIIQLLSIIILFIIIKLLFGIVRFVLNKLAMLPVLKTFNKVSGMFIGFIEGVIISVVIVVVISLFPNEELQNELDNSLIGNKVSEVVMSTLFNGIEVSDLDLIV